MERLFNGRSPNEQSSAQELASTGESRCNRFASRDMSDHVIVWDLETVPDILGYAAANGLTGKSGEEIRDALGTWICRATIIYSVNRCSFCKLQNVFDASYGQLAPRRIATNCWEQSAHAEL